MMDVPDELTKNHVVLQVKDGFVGSVGHRLIGKLQHHPRGEQEQYQDYSHAPQPPGESESQGSLPDNIGTEMQDQSIQPTPVTPPLILDFVGMREDRIPDSLKEVGSACVYIQRGH